MLVPNPQFPGLTTPAHQTQYTPSAYGRTLPAQTFGTDRRQTIGVSTATSSTPFASQPKSVGFRQPQFRPPTTSNPTSSSSTPYRSSQGDGGSLGIYTHANSPLKKTTNAYDFEATRGTPRNGREAARREIAEDRERERRRTEKVERGWGGIQVKRPKEEERRRTLFQ